MEREQPEHRRPPEARSVMTRVACHGVAAPNPGHGGIGVVIRSGTGAVLAEVAEYLGPHVTNNTAAYTAVIRGMETAQQLGRTSLAVTTTSQLVVQQVWGRWQVTQPHVWPLCAQVTALLAETKATLAWVPQAEHASVAALAWRAVAQATGASRPAGSQPLRVAPSPHPAHYRVQSSTGRQWYEVDLVASSCTCPAYRHRRVACKHLQAVWGVAAPEAEA